MSWFGHGALHAYVRMTNPVPLLLTPEVPSAMARLVIAWGRRYVHSIHKTSRRTGTLWDSRYTCSLMQGRLLARL